MRRLIGWVLLALLVHGTMLVFPATHLYRHHARQSMRHAMRGRHAQRSLRFALKVVDGRIQEQGFAWEEHDREFTLHGTLYDITSITYTRDRCLVTCVADSKESIAARLAKLFLPDEDDEGAPAGLRTMKLRPDPFLPVESPAMAACPLPARSWPCERAVSMRSFVGGVPTPPPWA